MKYKFFKYLSVFVVVNLLTQIFWPATAWALTGGPSQPEVQSFEPVGTNEMVDPFSGDFIYNIPLMDVGGYPINISYHSGINMDQEASWVGLGWNINPGVINRNVRGLPDDFDGDVVTKETNIKPNKTTGVGAGIGLEIVGLKTTNSIGVDLDMSLGIFYNNYKGWGYEFSVDPSISAGQKDKWSGNAGLGLNFNSQEGIGVTPSLGFSVMQEEKGKESKSAGITIGAPYNSRAGLKSLTLSTNFSVQSEHERTVDGKTDEAKSGIQGGNGGSFLSFGTRTYTPELSAPMENYNFSLRFTLGSEALGFNGHVYVNGYTSGQKFIEKTQNIPAYGYLNLQDSRGQDKFLMDFNREKDGVYTDQTPNLPLTSLTYDIYSVEANGIGGCYRPHRSDIGSVWDADITNTSTSASIGAELGSINLLKVGLNIGINESDGRSGGWSAPNDISSKMQFIGKEDRPNDPFFEPSYFKNAGEKAAIDEAFYASIHKDDAVAPLIDGDGGISNYQDNDNNLPNPNNNTFSIPDTSQTLRHQRDKRNSPLTFLDAQDASYFGLDKNIVSYQPNVVYNDSGNLPIETIYPRVNTYAKAHHLSEITVLKPDGTRYVFGIPAYNNSQEEATFSVNGIPVNKSEGLVAYNPGDNSLSNTEGSDNYYNSTHTPPFEHSFLLTAVLSPDYVDITGDGITDDDYGTAIKFNYTKAIPNYKWRIPYGLYNANYNEGFKTDPLDDKGSYLYGTKDVWYLTSIVSKHYLALFKTSNRNDGIEAAGRDGTMPGTLSYLRSMQKLDAIELYAREDLQKHGSAATPIKTVNFVYNYSLCPQVTNNTNTGGTSNTGKLTLKKIYFTYQNSPKGKLNSYYFGYSSCNPKYNLKGYDRWGNFKPNATEGECDSLSDSTKRLSNSDFPYVNQNKDSADKYASAWSMDTIGLPSGGQILVNYESDDYAYVQNQRAMQMFQVVGASSGPSLSAGANNSLYNSGQNMYLFFKLQNSLSSSTARRYIYNEYLNHGNLQQLYFKFLMDLKGNNTLEYVPGYADIDYSDTTNYGVTSGYGYIKVKPSMVGSTPFNPIARASWQFLRLNVPKLLYNQHPDGTSDNAIAQSMVGFAMDIKSIFNGFENACLNNGYARNFIMNKSFIRLNSPTKFKLGGGARVKQVSINDNWNNMVAGQPAAQYGQVYDYTTSELQPDGSTKTISSGVASYEPVIGGDENPWHTAVSYDESNFLAPDNEHYQETPFGECFFPAPSVGYSRVKIANLPHPGVERTATGYTIQEFYTEKDFPTIVKQTDIQRQKENPPNILNWLFRIGIKDHTTAAQGYCIELNDMNGKPKAKSVYAENKKDPISSVAYYYRTNKQNPNVLDNNVTVIQKDGTVSNTEVGVDFDAVNDFREQSTNVNGTNLGFNLDFSVAGIIPLPLITFWPSYSNEDTRFRSAVTTKVVQRYGILDSVVAYDNTSRITTENIAYDAETGDVLLTRTQNEWDDPVYTFNYPAHWMYSGMSGAYKNIGVKFTNLQITGGQLINLKHPELYFTPGDEIKVTKYPSNKSDWGRLVVYKNDTGIYADRIWVESVNGGLVFIDRWGKRVDIEPNIDPLTGTDTYTFEIIRSGYRNQQTAPVGSVTTLYNPLKTAGHLQLDSQVISTSATEYSDQWQTYCSIVPYIECNPITSQAKDFLKLLNALASNENLAQYTPSLSLPTSLDSPGTYNFYHASSLRHHLDSLVYKTKTDSCESLSYHHYFYERLPYRYSKPSIDTIKWVLHGTLQVNSCSPELGICDFYISSDNDTNFSFAGVDSFNNLLPNGDMPGPDYSFNINAYKSDHAYVLSGIACFKISDCNYACQTLNPSNSIINPYIYGIRGDWRPKRSHVYLQKRNESQASNITNIRKNGTLVSYHHFWNNPNSSGGTNDWQPNTGDSKWVWNSEITKYSPYGTEIEDRDPLNRYSSAIFDFHQSVPAAVSNNAKYRQIAFDGFEDYQSYFFTSSQLCDPAPHWKFENALTSGMIDTTISHTGKRSLGIPAGDTIHVFRSIDYCNPLDPSDTTFYKVKQCDCIEQFSPDTGEKYVFTAWVTQASAAPLDSFYQPKMAVKIYRSAHSPFTITFNATGPIIENWQKIYGVFTIPADATGIDVTAYAAPSAKTNFDDIRIHPFKANMKTYVYDPVSLRLMAEIDENNYATIYEYDQEGALIRVKKETVKGIMTIKESRNSKSKAGL